MTLISLVINCDTRSGFTDPESSVENTFNGCRSIDFLLDGIRNKIKFFDQFEKEVIVFIDEHEIIPEKIVSEIRFMVDTLIIRKHDKNFGDIKNYTNFNDLNYLSALFMARGEIIVHADQDCSLFAKDSDVVKNLIKHLDTHDFVSYPSHASPKAVDDPTFDYSWVSTRFFMCKREALDFGEIMKCLIDYDYLYATYPASRKCHWTEHILGLLAKYKGKGVYYPQMDLNNYAIFCWNKYKSGTLLILNNIPYNDVKQYIEDCTGIHYPCDVTAK
jgi:hypothetical protein